MCHCPTSLHVENTYFELFVAGNILALILAGSSCTLFLIHGVAPMRLKVSEFDWPLGAGAGIFCPVASFSRIPGTLGRLPRILHTVPAPSLSQTP